MKTLHKVHNVPEEIDREIPTEINLKLVDKT